MGWVQHDLTERTEHLPDLLHLVRLPLISSKYLLDFIQTVSYLHCHSSFRQIKHNIFTIQIHTKSIKIIKPDLPTIYL